jgi:ketosteroid isomerase-like protein
MRNDAYVQSVQAIYDAFVRGDVPAILEHLSDEVHWIHTGAPELPYGKVDRGKAQVAQFFADLAGVLEFKAFQAHTYVSEGEFVVALGDYETRALAGGGIGKDNWAMAWTFKDGKVIRYQAYVDTLSGAKTLGAVVPAGAPATA